MINIQSIPKDLICRRQWVRWIYEERGGKPTKIPIQCDGTCAKSDDSQTWTTFGEVVESQVGDGIGFVFTEEDPFIGIDLDNCIADDVIKPWGQQFIDRFASYCEISPSRKGIKMWVKGEYHGEGTGKRRPYKDGQVEMYASRRYFTVTGWHVEGTPYEITEQQSGIDGLYNHILAPKPETHFGPSKVTISHPQTDWASRAMVYIDKCPESISGEGGHDRTFHIACLCFEFGLSEQDAWGVMEWYSQSKCRPPWTTGEIKHKLDSALKAVAKSGTFGKRTRDMSPARVPIAKPPESLSALDKHVEDIIEGKKSNIPWPWPRLTSLARALLPGTITQLGGSPGATKTMLVSQSCIFWLEQEIPFAVFHLEEDREFHLLRALAQLAGNGNLTKDDFIRQNPDVILSEKQKYTSILSSLGQSIWDAPESDISLDDLEHWLRDRAHENKRIVVVDPITGADSGRTPWLADRKFVLTAKRIMRASGMSLILVTHPRDADPKSAARYDNHAGGQAYNRSSQCSLNLEAVEPVTENIKHQTCCGTITEPKEINRMLRIRKARNGAGGGQCIGGWFDKDTFLFTEYGVVVK